MDTQTTLILKDTPITAVCWTTDLQSTVTRAISVVMSLVIIVRRGLFLTYMHMILVGDHEI